MLEESLTTRSTRLIAVTLVAVVLSGCSQTKGWLDSVRGNEAVATDDQVIPGAPAADEYRPS
jgi:PBP1b-binding outer membrane lipoprotein LpoB